MVIEKSYFHFLELIFIIQQEHYDIRKIKIQSWEIMDHDLFLDLNQKIMIPWSRSWKSHDPDQKLVDFFGSGWKIGLIFFIKIGHFFFYGDKKNTFFLIRIKKWLFFWSWSKNDPSFFDPDQKMTRFFWSGSINDPFFLIRIKNWQIFFLIRIKNWPNFFWSGSKIARFDPDQQLPDFYLIRIKNQCDFFLIRIKSVRLFF